MDEKLADSQSVEAQLSLKMFWRLNLLSREHRVFRQLIELARSRDSSPAPSATVKNMTKRYGEGMFDQPFALKTARSVLKTFQTLQDENLIGTLRLPPEVSIEALYDGITDDEKRELLRIQSPVIETLTRAHLEATTGYTTSVVAQIAVEMEPLGPTIREDLYARLVRTLEQHLTRLLDINLGICDHGNKQSGQVGQRIASVHTMLSNLIALMPAEFDPSRALLSEMKETIAIRDSIIHRESRADEEFNRWVPVDDYHLGSLIDNSEESLLRAANSVFGFCYRSLFLNWRGLVDDLGLARYLLNQTQSDLLLHEEWRALHLATDISLDEFEFDEETKQVLRVNSLLGAKNHLGIEIVRHQILESEWVKGVEWDLVRFALLDNDSEVLRILRDNPELMEWIVPSNKVFDRFRNRGSLP
jgi:hypothetical protein